MFKFAGSFFLMILMTFSIQAQITEANYRIYDAKGNPATLDQVIDSLQNADAVFLGEEHNDAVAHHLQAEIFRRAFLKYGRDRKLALSLEMFERDVQVVVDEYLKNLITEKKFLDDSRPWKNYQTDYRPLVEFAKTAGLPVIAANAPRRYVNMVSRGGRDSLSALTPLAKSWLAPLPFGEPSEAYSKKFKALMGGMPESSAHGLDRILASQSLWDATMAHSVSEFLKGRGGALVVHLNGGFHSESRLGAVEHFLRYQPEKRALVVTMKSDKNFTTFDRARNENLGDFVILTDAGLPRSY